MDLMSGAHTGVQTTAPNRNPSPKSPRRVKNGTGRQPRFLVLRLERYVTAPKMKIEKGQINYRYKKGAKPQPETRNKSNEYFLLGVLLFFSSLCFLPSGRPLSLSLIRLEQNRTALHRRAMKLNFVLFVHRNIDNPHPSLPSFLPLNKPPPQINQSTLFPDRPNKLNGNKI